MSFCYLSSQRASFILNCRSSLQVQIPIKPLYQSIVSPTISFCYFYSKRASLPLNFFPSSSAPTHKKPGFPAVIVFWSVFVTFIQREHRFHSTAVLLYKLRYLRSRYTRVVLTLWSVSVTFFQKEERLHATFVDLYQFRYVRSRDS